MRRPLAARVRKPTTVPGDETDAPMIGAKVGDRSFDPADHPLLLLLEHVRRTGLRPVARARVYIRQIMDAKRWSIRRLAREIYVGQSSVVKALALLDLPPEEQAAVESGAMTASEGYERAKGGPRRPGRARVVPTKPERTTLPRAGGGKLTVVLPPGGGVQISVDIAQVVADALDDDVR